MSLEQAIKTENDILKYSLTVLKTIFESETKYKVEGRIGDYLVFKKENGEFAAVDITDDLFLQSKFTRIRETPDYKNVDELQLYLCDLMIDKFVLLKRSYQQKLGKHEYGTPYM
jgi:hypothetical protein